MTNNNLSHLTGWDTDDEVYDLGYQVDTPSLMPTIVEETTTVHPDTTINEPLVGANAVSQARRSVPKPPILVVPGTITTVERTATSSVHTPVLPQGASTGWEEVAPKIKTIIDFPNNSVLKIHIDGHGELVIDPLYNAWTWSTPLKAFPTVVTGATAVIEKAELDENAAMTHTGADLVPLLWLIGLNSFNGQLAPWLKENEQYKLMRWPNLTEFDLSLDQVYITSILGSAAASINELVGGSNADRTEVVNTINALSLMGLLSTYPYQGPAGGRRLNGAKNKDSLFAKLRRKIGW